MKERNMLQKIVSLGSAFTNGLLLAAISYTSIKLAATLFRGPLTTPTHIGQVSLYATGLALIGVFALYFAAKTGIANLRASFQAKETAPQATVATNFTVALLTTAIVSLFSGMVNLGAPMICTVVALAFISCVLALTALDQYQPISA